MINLLPEEEKPKKQPSKKEEAKIEIKQPIKPEPKFEVKPKIKFEPESEIKPESKPEPVVKPESKPGPPPAKKTFVWLQKFLERLRFKEKKKESEEIQKPSIESSLVTPEVTLVPEKLPIITKRMVQERIFILLAVCAFSILLVFITWLWVTWRIEIAQGEVNRIKIEIQTVETQIASYNDLIKEIKNLEQKAERVNNLLNNHIYWTKFFKLLETYTIPDIYYGDFSADTSGKVVLPTVGRDLIAVARQFVAFSNASDFIQTVTITDLTAGVKGVNFNTNLILQPTVFKK